MITMFKTNTYSFRIEERECTKVTDKSIYWINDSGKEERALISSSWVDWHRTKEEAVNFMIKIKENAITRHNSDIEKLRAEINKIKELYQK